MRVWLLDGCGKCSDRRKEKRGGGGGALGSTRERLKMRGRGRVWRKKEESEKVIWVLGIYSGDNGP